MLNYAHKNYWRVAAWYDELDLVADGYLVYSKCRRKYHDVIDPPHFMALFQRCYVNHVTDLANSRSKCPEQSMAKLLHADEDETSFMESLGSYEEPDAALRVLIRTARFPVRAVLELFATERGIQIVRAYPQASRENMNKYLCRLIGVSPKEFDLPGLVRSFLHGSGMYFLHGPNRDIELIAN